MSSSNKSAMPSGGKGASKTKSQHGKSDHQAKSSDSSKYDKAQSTTVQIRYAQIIDTRMGGGDDLVLKERIKQVMDMTRRSEDEVIMALHDSDGDLDQAVNNLLEGVKTEWEVKKKKPRQPSGSKQNPDTTTGPDEAGDWGEERRNQRGNAPTRMRGRANHENRGWRGRENKENERNMEDGVRDNSFGGNRRGRGGPSRSGRGGRGGGRGLGPRTFANRNDTVSTSTSHSFNRPIETWTGSEEQQRSLQEPKMDSWNMDPSEDWDNEEYTGSLADTKVFTPSTTVPEPTPTLEEPKIQELPSTQSLPQEETPNLSEISTVQQALIQQPPIMNLQSMHLSQQPNAVTGGVLTPAQTQFFTQLTHQTSENLKASGQTPFSSSITNQPPRQVKQRPRVPPPSKIPSSAVEMPGDAVNSSIGFLDVQFGGLEFGSDSSSLDGSANEKFSSTNNAISGVDASPANAVGTTNANSSLNVETTQTSTSQFNANSQMLSNSESLPITSEHHIGSQNFTGRGSGASQSLDMPKQEFNSQNSPIDASTYGTATTYQSQKSSFQTSNAAPSTYNAYSTNTQSIPSSYQNTSTGNVNNYSAATTVSQTGYGSSSFPPSNASTFNQASPSGSVNPSYNQPTTTNQVYQTTSGYPPVTTSQYQPQSIATNTAVSNSNPGYQTNNYQASSSFQSTPQVYQPSGTTFTTPITQTSGVYQNAAQSVYASAYGSYTTQQPQPVSHSHKLNSSSTTKDTQYESSTTTSNSSLSTTTAPTLGLGSTTGSNSQTKVTNSNAVPKSTSSSVVTGSAGTGNITGGGATSGLAPMMSHQYIMGQGVPYAIQQPMYSYEDLQMMQQRMSHMPTTGYYDATLGYQTTGPATSLGGGRGDALSGIQGVQGVQGVQGAYTSISDARFARNDSNASPVPSTMSQQTATQHQQPMMNPTLPPTYAYFTYSGGIMPGGFQYGTPAIYPQIATAGNAGNNSGAYSAKPGSYGSGYGAGTSYDTLASAGPSGEYKGAGSSYTGTQSGKTGSSTGNTSTDGSSPGDLSATMYAKSHVALSKVNSYEKQTFHSATPPPFNLTGSQNAGLPAYGGPHLFIPTMAHQLHQPLHQDGASTTGQRSNTNSQNKAQSKPGYSPSYWNRNN